MILIKNLLRQNKRSWKLFKLIWEWFDGRLSHCRRFQEGESNKRLMMCVCICVIYWYLSWLHQCLWFSLLLRKEHRNAKLWKLGNRIHMVISRYSDWTFIVNHLIDSTLRYRSGSLYRKSHVLLEVDRAHSRQHQYWEVELTCLLNSAVQVFRALGPAG